MNILLTGASGFIGRHITTRSSIKRVVVRSRTASNTSSQFEIDTLNGATNWNGAFSGIDAVIHLAGLAHSNRFCEQEYQSVNVDGTLHLAQEAFNAGVRRFVFVSSIGVNGTSTANEPFTPASLPAPHNEYAQSKYRAELKLKQLAAETGLELVIVRPTLVYGPGAPGNFGMLTQLVKRVPILPFGCANNRRDFIAVQNLADLLVVCAKHPNAAGHTFLASDGKSMSTKELTNAIANGVSSSLLQLPVPVFIMKTLGKVVNKSAMIDQLYGNLEVDSSQLQTVLDWMPSMTVKQVMQSLNENNQ